MTPDPVPEDVTIPEGYTFSGRGTCRSCGVPIVWAVTAKGRAAPLNLDGISHYATCPQAATWRKK